MPYRPRFRGRIAQPAIVSAVDYRNPNDSGLETSATSTPTIILSVIVVILGVAYILWRRKTDARTGPLVTLVPDYSADSSRITNMIGTLAVLETNSQLGAANGS